MPSPTCHAEPLPRLQPHAARAPGGPHDALAEALVLVERVERRERLAALVALDLLPAVGVHALVAAQVRELGVRLQGESGEW